MGCHALSARLPELRPRIHLAGHIHEAHGAHIHHWTRDNKAPAVQNDNDDMTQGDLKVQPDHKKQQDAKDIEMLDVGGPSSAESTVFVNGANWPSGPHAWRGTIGGKNVEGRVPFGGPGFQPIVVDLKD